MTELLGRPSFSRIALAIVALMGASSSAMPERRTLDDARPFVETYPPYAAIESDADLNEKFTRYLRWLAGLGAPDAELVLKLVEEGAASADALSLVHHEKIELREWLRLGHAFDDIMRVDYYRAHYEQVYPIAHARAVSSELGLLRHYALRRGFPPISALSLALVSPLVERLSATVAQVARRLRYNPEILREARCATREKFELAIRIYSEGGYPFNAPTRLVDQAMDFILSTRDPSPAE